MAELDELTYEAVEDEDSLLDQKWAPSCLLYTSPSPRD